MRVASPPTGLYPDPTTGQDPPRPGWLGDRRYLKIGSFLTLIGAGLIGVLWALGSDRSKSPQVVRSRMHADLRAGHLDRCATALAWLEGHDRLTSQDRMVRARIQQLGGRLDEAIVSLDQVADRDPLGPQARLMAGLIELERDRARPAEAAFRTAIALDPGQASARFELVRLYSRQQRLDELDEQFDALARRNLLDFGLIRFWFMTRHAPWEAEDDIESLRRMAEADAEDRWSRLALAEGLRRLGRADEAREVLGPMPDEDAGARAIRALLAIDGGDVELAEQLLADGPSDDARLARLRGHLALMQRDGLAAIRHFRRARAANPDDRTTMAGLATALKAAGQTVEAEGLLSEVRRFDELSPLIGRIVAAGAATDAELHRRLGSLCEAIGRRAEARAWYRLAIVRDPLDADAQRALFRLEGAAATPPPSRSPAAHTPNMH